MKILRSIVILICMGWFAPASADSTAARCDIYPAGSDHTDRMIGCTFAQRQGFITITRDDGVTHDLSPKGDRPGNFLDQRGRAVYRQSGLGDQGLIFRFPDESVFVYWNTAGLEPVDSENPTWPFTTRDYDATALLRCWTPGQKEAGNCPAGILRADGGRASIVVQDQSGNQFTINFMTDYINATNRQIEARLEGDTWIVKTGSGDIYEVPLAAIEGG